MTNTDFRAALARLGMEQKDFAAAVGVSRNTVSRWALGKWEVPKWVPLVIDQLGNPPLRPGCSPQEK